MRGVPRARTVSVKQITRAELRVGAQLNPPVEGVERPTTRAQCRDGERPCPWVACRHHLYLDVNAETGSIKINFPNLEPWELQHTCSLDVADSGGQILEALGGIMNLTRERIRQVEVRGLLQLKANARHYGLDAASLAEFPHPEGGFESPEEVPSPARVESAKRARAAYVDRQKAAKEIAAAATTDEEDAA